MVQVDVARFTCRDDERRDGMQSRQTPYSPEVWRRTARGPCAAPSLRGGRSLSNGPGMITAIRLASTEVPEYLAGQAAIEGKRDAIGTYLESGLSGYQVPQGVNPQKQSDFVGPQGPGFPVTWEPRYTAAFGPPRVQAKPRVTLSRRCLCRRPGPS